jgi:hypothetical protein
LVSYVLEEISFPIAHVRVDDFLDSANISLIAIGRRESIFVSLDHHFTELSLKFGLHVYGFDKIHLILGIYPYVHHEVLE